MDSKFVRGDGIEIRYQHSNRNTLPTSRISANAHGQCVGLAGGHSCGTLTRCPRHALRSRNPKENSPHPLENCSGKPLVSCDTPRKSMTVRVDRMGHKEPQEDCVLYPTANRFEKDLELCFL